MIKISPEKCMTQNMILNKKCIKQEPIDESTYYDGNDCQTTNQCYTEDSKYTIENVEAKIKTEVDIIGNDVFESFVKREYINVPSDALTDMEAMAMADDAKNIVNNDDDNSSAIDDGDSDSTVSTTDETVTMDLLVPVKNAQEVVVTQPTTTKECFDMEAIAMADDDDNRSGIDDGDSSDSTDSNTDQIPDDLYECRDCNKHFKYKSWYMNHMTTHSVNGVHKCRYCSKLFKRKDNLKRHFLTHFGGISYDCSVCGQSFSLRHNLVMHIKMQHTTVTLHKCTKCQMAFKDPRNLQYHDNVKHTMICPYICTPCGTAFGAPNQLARHRRQNEH